MPYLFINLSRLTTMTTKKNLLAYLFAGLFITCITGACSKNDAPAPEEEEKEEFTIINEYTKQDTNGVVYVTDYPLDQAAITEIHTYTDFTYFDFNSNAFVSIDKAKSPTDWDIAFKGKDGSNIFMNGFAFNNHFEDPLEGDNRVAYLRGDFDAIETVPEESVFTHRYSLQVNTAALAAEQYNIWAVSENSNDNDLITFTPIPEHLAVYKLTDGRYVKFKMISIYKGALTTPTPQDYQTKRGFISFKYCITEEGSTDLTTKK